MLVENANKYIDKYKQLYKITVDTSSYMKTNKVGAVEPANPYSIVLFKVTLLVIPIGKREVPGTE